MKPPALVEKKSLHVRAYDTVRIQTGEIKKKKCSYSIAETLFLHTESVKGESLIQELLINIIKFLRVNITRTRVI